MRIGISFFLFLLIAIDNIAIGQDLSVKAMQEESIKTTKKLVVDTSSKTWKKGILYSLNFSQASLSNWSAGGDKFSLSVSSILNTYANYKKGKNSWDNSFEFNFGYVNSTSLGSRKNDDRFDLVSKYGYALNNKLNIAALFNLRSQFFKGYTYEGVTKNFASNFMSPGYVLQSFGLDYKPSQAYSLFFSPITGRWVFVTDPVLSARGLYGVKPGENSAFEIGAFANLNFMKVIAPNITFKSRLDLFSNYRNNPQNVDLFMTNLLTVKLSKLFNVTWAVDMIYDDDAKLFGPNGNSPSLQFKSLIGIGVQFKK
ncbi:MAG: DUF3078 domain-containing protein [Chitinophagaceae bacterium]|nr:DUF3078 domain-containing protein [Chitinophagaceae bacterium]